MRIEQRDGAAAELARAAARAGPGRDRRRRRRRHAGGRAGRLAAAVRDGAGDAGPRGGPPGGAAGGPAAATVPAVVKPVLIVENDQLLAGAGWIARVLDRRGLPYRQVDATAGGLDGIDAAELSGLITLGGRAHAWQEDADAVPPHRTAADGAVPRARRPDPRLLPRRAGAGARARRDGAPGAPPASTAGSTSHRRPRAARDPLFRLAATADAVYLWHDDEFRCPPDAVHLSTSAATPMQAFRHGRAWGLQFHPECDLPLYDFWHGNFPDACDAGRPRPGGRCDRRPSGGSATGRPLRGAADRRVRVGRAHVAPARPDIGGYVPAPLRAARRALARARPDRGPARRARRADVPDRAARRGRARAGRRRRPARAGDGVAAEGRRLLVVGRADVPPVRRPTTSR